MTDTFRLSPPTERQEKYIADLCEQRGLEPPEVIASSEEASRIITEILERRYNAEDYIYPFRVGTGLSVLDGTPRESAADADAFDARHGLGVYEGVRE